VRDRIITVNNPAIWRPIVSTADAANAYIRAIEASERISGIFNIASGNYTVGETADQVRSAVEELLGIRVKLEIRHIRDLRNYKVSISRAENTLSFHPDHNVKSIVANLAENLARFNDWDNEGYYNILTLKALEFARSAASYTVGASA
jgi:nucleoside-diphosphate-sugar epimerase